MRARCCGSFCGAVSFFIEMMDGERPDRPLMRPPPSSLLHVSVKARLQPAYAFEVGVGSTPTCSCPPEHLRGVTEMHPGNYLLYDSMQATIGSCEVGDIAVVVNTRVIGRYPSRNELVVDLGWTGILGQGAEAGFGMIIDHPELK